MNKFKSIWWVVKLQYRSSRAAFFWNIFYYAYDGANAIFATYVTAQLITSVTKIALQQASANTAYFWLFVLFGVEAINIALRSINSLLDRRSLQKLELYTSSLFFNKLYELNQEQFDDEVFNTKLSRAQDGMNRLGRVVRELSWSLSSLVRVVGALVAIIVVAPLVGLLIVLAIIPVAYLRVRQNRLNEKVYVDVEPIERVAYRTQWMLMETKFMPEIRMINGFKKLLKVWKTNMSKAQDMYFAVDKKIAKFDFVTDAAQPAISLLANLYFLRLLVMGSLGLDKFLFLRGILEQASSSALSLASSFDTLHELSINIDNVQEVLQTPPVIPNGSVKISAPLTIEFRDVDFIYPSSPEKVLDGISFQIVPGSKLALVGENGAGKSTIIKLILRQYLPSSGQILVNGHDMKDIDHESYYQVLSNLSQDFQLINHLTIADNLTIGLDRKVSKSEIRKVTDMVGATGFIEKFKHGFDQRLDPSFKDGTSTSGGQFQRIGIARALLRNADVMILDEPTSAIDAKAEFTIFNNIYEHHGSKTTLIVSHRFSTVRKADMIMVVDAGKVIEYGSHAELMKYKGLYEEMFSLQAEGYR